MKIKIIVFILMAAFTARLHGQRPFKYYNLDNIVTVKGEITDIKREPCYRQNDFIVIYLTDRQDEKQYKVEVSPRWFYHIDLVKGNKIEVSGALNRVNGDYLIMASSILFEGELYHFRDRNGFPLWRGRGKRQQRSGRMRRRGGR
jgi:hypothetical protein